MIAHCAEELTRAYAERVIEVAVDDRRAVVRGLREAPDRLAGRLAAQLQGVDRGRHDRQQHYRAHDAEPPPETTTLVVLVRRRLQGRSHQSCRREGPRRDQAVHREARADDLHVAHAGPRQFLQRFVRVGLQPRLPADARLEAHVPFVVAEVQRLRTDDGIREAARDELGYVADGEDRETVMDAPPLASE